MAKVKFRNAARTTREMRRIGERELERERRQKAVAAYFALSPEERAQRMADNEAYRRISKNGITLEDVHKAEDEAFDNGVKAGKNATIRTCFAAICMVLHDKCGFDGDACSDVLNAVYDQMVFSLTSQEAIQEVYDTMGLEITFSDDVTQDTVTRRESICG